MGNTFPSLSFWFTLFFFRFYCWVELLVTVFHLTVCLSHLMLSHPGGGCHVFSNRVSFSSFRRQPRIMVVAYITFEVDHQLEKCSLLGIWVFVRLSGNSTACLSTYLSSMLSIVFLWLSFHHGSSSGLASWS